VPKDGLYSILPLVPGNGNKMEPEILSKHDQYRTDMDGNFRSTVTTVRLHPHRRDKLAGRAKDKFRPQPVWNF